MAGYTRFANPNPIASLADALSEGVEGWGQKRRQDAYTSALSQALGQQPVDQVAVTPNLTSAPTGDTVQSRQMSGAYNQPTERDIFSKILGSGNQDVISQFAPLALQSQIQSQAQANAPITPYQRANLQRETDTAKATRDAAQFNAQAQREFTGGQGDLNRQNARDIADIRAKSALGSAENVQSVQQVQLDNGQAGIAKVYRNGKVEISTLDGKPVVSSLHDPGALYNQSAARKGGGAAGTAAEAFPTVQANFDLINKTLAGFEDPMVKKEAPYALGAGSLIPTLPGRNSNFRARYGQLQGQTFLQAYNTLRGSGAITEPEGAKGTAAIARLNAAQTPDEFYSALADAKATFGELFAAAKQRAGRGAVVPQMQGEAQPQAAPQAQPAKVPRYNPQTGEFE